MVSRGNTLENPNQAFQENTKKVDFAKTLWKAICEENQAKFVGGAKQSEHRQYIGSLSVFNWHWKH